MHILQGPHRWARLQARHDWCDKLAVEHTTLNRNTDITCFHLGIYVRFQESACCVLEFSQSPPAEPAHASTSSQTEVIIISAWRQRERRLEWTLRHQVHDRVGGGGRSEKETVEILYRLSGEQRLQQGETPYTKVNTRISVHPYSRSMSESKAPLM